MYHTFEFIDIKYGHMEPAVEKIFKIILTVQLILAFFSLKKTALKVVRIKILVMERNCSLHK